MMEFLRTRLKLRVRTLIIVVAVVAIILAITVHESRRQRLRFLSGMVERYSERQTYWSDQEKAMRQYESVELAARRTTSAANFASQALYDQDQAEYYGLLLRKYEEALHQPGLAIDPDPRAPWLFPRDYLSKVPYHVPDRKPGERPME